MDLKDNISGSFSGETIKLSINGKELSLTKSEARGLARMLWEEYGCIAWT